MQFGLAACGGCERPGFSNVFLLPFHWPAIGTRRLKGERNLCALRQALEGLIQLTHPAASFALTPEALGERDAEALTDPQSPLKTTAGLCLIQLRVNWDD